MAAISLRTLREPKEALCGQLAHPAVFDGKDLVEQSRVELADQDWQPSDALQYGSHLCHR
jgi:hypothetical protein